MKRSGNKVISNHDQVLLTALIETICDATAPMPAVSETQAVSFFDSYLAHSPFINRYVVLFVVRGANLAPLISGRFKTFLGMTAQARGSFLAKWSKAKSTPLVKMFKLLQSVVAMAYYSDDHVVRLCGYDPEQNLERGRQLRAREGRP